MFGAASAPDWAAVTAGVSTAVATIILAVTAALALRQLHDAHRARDAALLIDLSRRWDEPLIVESQKLFAIYTSEGITELIDRVYNPAGATEKEQIDFTKLEALPNLWETLGVLRAEQAVSLSVIDRMWGVAITGAWKDWEAPIGRLREVTNTPTSYNYFERLAAALSEYERKERLLLRRLAAILRMGKRRPPKALKLRIYLRTLIHRLKK